MYSNRASFTLNRQSRCRPHSSLPQYCVVSHIGAHLQLNGIFRRRPARGCFNCLSAADNSDDDCNAEQTHHISNFRPFDRFNWYNNNKLAKLSNYPRCHYVVTVCFPPGIMHCTPTRLTVLPTYAYMFDIGVHCLACWQPCPMHSGQKSKRTSWYSLSSDHLLVSLNDTQINTGDVCASTW